MLVIVVVATNPGVFVSVQNANTQTWGAFPSMLAGFDCLFLLIVDCFVLLLLLLNL